jgi:signal transduction histidine kinase
MHGELARLGRLVADLLTLSRLDGRAPMQRGPVDVAKTVGEVAAQLAPLAETKGVRLLVRAESPAIVQGDPDKLKQVVINLVDNAVRYTPPDGEVRLSVDVDRTRRLARIEVRDTGPGIPPKDLTRIFDRFYRGDLSRTRATGNTGLGLAIARAITEAHGGTIGVQSEDGQGACFTITLPADLPMTLPVRTVRQGRSARATAATGSPPAAASNSVDTGEQVDLVAVQEAPTSEVPPDPLRAR